MKTKILLSIIVLSSLAFTANIATRETAIANKENGLYIYTDSKPAMKYQVIETINCGLANVDLKSFEAHPLEYSQLKADLFKTIAKKKNKTKFTGAEALIIYPDQQKADVIKFVE